MNTTLSLLNIVFVIGGPGVGKGTLCSLLEQEWPTKLIHIRLGDILRAEREKPESQWADVLQKNLREGRIGSKEMVIQLLGDRLDELAAQDKQKVILLDGFPRALDRCLLFEDRICNPIACVVLQASTETLKKRLAGRARDDDHGVAVEQRLETWHQQSEEVLEHYRSRGILIEVNAEGEKEKVLREMEKEMAQTLRAVDFFMSGRGRSKSAGEGDGKEDAGDGLPSVGTRKTTPR